MASSSPTPVSRWNHWCRRALPAYWIFLFCCTHFPKLKLGPIGVGGGKLVHFVGFGLLAFLFWQFAQSFKERLSGRFVWIAGFWLVLYAAFDEYSQGFVGRGVDIKDWFCNAAGIIVVLAVMEWRRRTAARRRTSPPPKHAAAKNGPSSPRRGAGA